MARIPRRKAAQAPSVAEARPQKSRKKRSLVDLLKQDGPEADFDFEPPRMSDDMGLRIPDFSEDAPAPGHSTSMAKVTSREFNQDVGKAKRAAEKGPVTITDRGRPAFVLMTYEEYQRLAGPRRSIADLLNHEATKDLEFEPVRMRDGWLHATDVD